MSGGHFDYQQYQIEDIANKLEKDIADVEIAKESSKINSSDNNTNISNGKIEE